MKRIRLRRLVFVLLPAVVCLGGAVAWHFSGESRYLLVKFPLPTLLASAGLFLSLCAWIALAWRSGRKREYADGLKAGQEELRQSHRQFLRRLDHELKNPLTALQAAAASHDAEDPSWSIVTAQSLRMSRLLTDLRKLSELETSPIDIEDVDLEETARDAVDAVAQELAARGESRSFSLSFPEAPWPLSHVAGDADLLYSAVYNLVSNAAKYSGAESVIEIRGSEGQGTVTVEVADTGIGIPAEDVGAVWDELSRASNSGGHPGNGLGLALVATIVARHGGTAHMSSRLGVGTSVSVTLPSAHPRA